FFSLSTAFLSTVSATTLGTTTTPSASQATMSPGSTTTPPQVMGTLSSPAPCLFPAATVVALQNIGKSSSFASVISRIAPSTTTPLNPIVCIIPVQNHQQWHGGYHL